MGRPRWRTAMAWIRSSHIYLTMFAFLMMMFFAATGVLLNHEDLLPGETTTNQEGSLPIALLTTPDSAAIITALRSSLAIPGAVSTFDLSDDALFVETKGPGRTIEVEIARATGHVKVTRSERGFLIRLDDLHRGKDSGAVWRWVIDISALLLFLGSLTGIIMWISLPRRRKWGVVAVGASLIVVVVIYLLVVP